MPSPRTTVLAIALAAGVLGPPAAARGHDLNATVQIRSGSVRAVVYFHDEFGDDAPAERAAVRVTDSSGAEVAAGTTDDTGAWTFPAPAPGAYTLHAESAGHVAAVPFAVPGAAGPPAPGGERPAGPPPADEPVAVYTGERPDKALGLALGTGGLLTASALVWLRRRA